MGTRAAAARGEARRRWRQRMRRDGLVLVPVLAVTLWYFRPLLVSADVLYGGLDLTRQFYLFKLAATTELQAGRLPLWLPTIYCGMPLLGALIDTPFHPWDLVAALLRVPLPVTFNVGLLLHLLAGQVGAYVWVRQDTYRRLPAVLAACWIWNPFILNSIVTGDHNNVRCMLLVPAIFAALERGLDRDRFRQAWLAYAGLQALQILCSGLQFAFYTCVLGGLTALGTVLHRRRREEPARLAARFRWWAFASVLALLLPMGQLLPGLEYGAYSVRGGIDTVWSDVWGISPGLLFSYVAPFVDRGSHMLLYWGIAPLVFAGIGLGAWRHPRRWWYLAILAGALVLCIGSEWSLSGWLNGLPILRRFRGPFRVALFANLMLVRFAAGGVATTLDYLEHHRHPRRWALGIRRTLMALGGLCAVALVWWVRSEFFDTWGQVPVTVAAWALTGAAAGMLLAARRQWALVLLAVLAPLDWAAHLRGYWRPESAAVFAADPLVAQLHTALGASGSRVWARGTASANYLGLFDVPLVAGHHAFPLARAARFAHALDLNDGRLLRVSGTQFVVTYRASPGAVPGPPVASVREAEVRRVRGAPVPPAQVRGSGRWLPSGPAVWEALRAPEWDPDAGAVLLEGEVPLNRRAVGSGGTAELVRATPGEREFAVESDGPGYVVIRETWYPDWQATVNGRPVDLLRANYLFQAVAVEDGRSTVVLRFRSAPARVGLFTTLLALLAVGPTVTYARRRDRERDP